MTKEKSSNKKKCSSKSNLIEKENKTKNIKIIQITFRPKNQKYHKRKTKIWDISSLKKFSTQENTVKSLKRNTPATQW